MFLALAEMRRAKARFGMLIVSIALLVFLILFQQSLRNGLLNSFIGAITTQSAPVLVYSVDGQRVIQGSVITPDAEALVASAEGVGEMGRLAQGTFSVTTSEGAFDASLIGYERPSLGAPETLTEGRLPAGPDEAVASDVDAADGFDIGDVVTVQPGGLEIEVVGLAKDAQLNAGPTLFVTYPTYLDAVVAQNPDAGEPPPNVIALAPADGVSDAELVANVNAQSDDLDALTKDDAARETPGVSQIQSSFLIIFALYALVVPCITGLFFLIVTFQKAAALTLLRAVGAPARRLVGALLIQATAILGLGYLLGVLLYAPVSQQRLGGIALSFETTAVVVWALILGAGGLLSSLFAARRVLRIDPIRATTGAGVGA